MTATDHINEFQAHAVLEMDNETRQAWESLSDFERKLITATNFYFVQGYKQAQRSKNVREMQFAIR